MADKCISAIMTVYNGEAYLREALDSILAQTYPSVEVIVVDDGSTDQTADILASYGDKITWQHQPNQGQGAGRNSGLAHATGELVAFLDADDIWVADKLEKQMQLLGKQRKLAMVFGLMKVFVSPELSEQRKQELKGDGDVLRGYSSGTILVWKDALLKAGLFPTHVRVGEFIDWYTRAKHAGLTEAMLEEIVMLRRLHNHNTGVLHKDQRRDYLRVLKDSLDRKRGN